MRFEKHWPSERLKPYVRYYVISENGQESTYKVFPEPGLVIGFQYRGSLAIVNGTQTDTLSRAGITGISDHYKVFKNTTGIGTVLVYFTETGFASMAALPANELFNISTSLEDIFGREAVCQTEDLLGACTADADRISVIEQFLMGQIRQLDEDKLVTEAIRLIRASGGTLRIRDLSAHLFISQSPLEKRFRKIVGTTPKKFASLVRFQGVLHNIRREGSLTDLSYEHQFFDQAHFIKDFKRYTGDSPDAFRRIP